MTELRDQHDESIQAIFSRRVLAATAEAASVYSGNPTIRGLAETRDFRPLADQAIMYGSLFDEYESDVAVQMVAQSPDDIPRLEAKRNSMIALAEEWITLLTVYDFCGGDAGGILKWPEEE